MINVIKEVSKEELKEFLYYIDIEDKNLYEEIIKGNQLGIFQFSANISSGLVKKVKPQNFDELSAVSCLARPGTIDFADEYNSNKQTGNKKYPEIVDNLLKDTHGVILLQEQVMSIFNKVGEFTLDSTNTVRSLMKKLSKADKKQSDVEKWDETVNKFIVGAKKNGLTHEEAKFVADDLLKMSGYLFNKSHAVSYTYTGIMTLYLSHYFKPYFYSATLTYEASKQNSDLKKIISDCRTSGFNILPPDVNKSNIHFSPEGSNIRFGLNEIKLVGENPSHAIIKNRPYASIIDFYIKNMGEGINKRTIIALIQSGAFDELINKERKKYTFVFEQFNERKKSTKVIEKLNFLWDTIENEANSIPGLETFHFHYVDYEKEYFGFPVFHSAFSDKLIKTLTEMNRRGLTELYFDELGDLKPLARVPVNVESFRTLIDKNGNEMAFLECTDLSGANKKIPIFQSYWKHVKENFTGEGIYLILLYYDIEKQEIYFGSKKWTDDSVKKRMLKRIPQ